MNKSIRHAILAVGIIAGSLSAGAHAAFPADKPVTMVVPFAAGGPTDKVAREIALAMGKTLKQQETGTETKWDFHILLEL